MRRASVQRTAREPRKEPIRLRILRSLRSSLALLIAPLAIVLVSARAQTTKPAPRDPQRELATSVADVAFGNFEGTALDAAHLTAIPQAEFGGAWIIDSPLVPKDLKSIGFDVMSRANNHAL